MKRKLLYFSLCGIIGLSAVGCNTVQNTLKENEIVQSKQEEKERGIEDEAQAVEEESETKNVVPTDFIKGYEYAEFDKFNSLAEENGLADTKIWLEGTFSEIEELDVGEDITYITILTTSDNHKWLLLLDSKSFASKDTYDSLCDKDLLLNGSYEGFSEVHQSPAMCVNKIYEKSSGAIISTSLYKLAKETDSENIAGNSKKDNKKKNDKKKKSKKKVNKNSSEFRKMLDEYEAFMDEYIVFMEKYSKSDGTDLKMITDYGKLVVQYADYTDKIDRINEDDLSNEDLKYYIEVTSRVSQKLVDASVEK